MGLLLSPSCLLPLDHAKLLCMMVNGFHDQVCPMGLGFFLLQFCQCASSLCSRARGIPQLTYN
eukprot:8471633-Prorocentrum_lima.AAC.1